MGCGEFEYSATHPEKGSRGTASEGPVLDFRLLGQVVGALDGRVHALNGEEGGQIGSVRGDHDEREEPPHAGHHPRGDGPVGTGSGTEMGE